MLDGDAGEVDRLAAFLLEARPVAVLSGAGISTESGIPDYRGPTGALRRHSPMTYQTFVSDPAARHRYWARSHLGWRQIATASPNAGHHSVAGLESAGLLAGTVTQNVDGLHSAAGSRDVVELHGSLASVVCLACRARTSRAELDRRLHAVNSHLPVGAGRLNPDGDSEVSDAALARFVMVGCATCGGGPLKPDIVFFGETVPVERVNRCYDVVERSGGLLVLGSSLAVMSGYRFVLRAARAGLPIAIVNRGPTRGDAQASLRIDAALGEVLPGLVGALGLAA